MRYSYQHDAFMNRVRKRDLAYKNVLPAAIAHRREKKEASREAYISKLEAFAPAGRSTCSRLYFLYTQYAHTLLFFGI